MIPNTSQLTNSCVMQSFVLFRGKAEPTSLRAKRNNLSFIAFSFLVAFFSAKRAIYLFGTIKRKAAIILKTISNSICSNTNEKSSVDTKIYFMNLSTPYRITVVNNASLCITPNEVIASLCHAKQRISELFTLPLMRSFFGCSLFAKKAATEQIKRVKKQKEARIFSLKFGWQNLKSFFKGA